MIAGSKVSSRSPGSLKREVPYEVNKESMYRYNNIINYTYYMYTNHRRSIEDTGVQDIQVLHTTYILGYPLYNIH